MSTAGQPPDAPAVAREVFGARLSLAVRYVDLLATQGVVRGLIGPREVPRLWDRHVLNSVALAPLVPVGADVVDVGSGAGLPGIPLALVRPDVQITLLEPLLRRSTFLSEVVARLDLPGVRVVRSRAEDLPTAGTDVVVARAVAPLPRLVALTLPALRPGGLLLGLKGRSAEQEMTDALPALERLRARSWQVRDLPVPGGEPTRAVVVVAGEGGPERRQ